MKRWLFSVVAVLLTFSAPALAGGKIKVGIMSDSEDVWAKVKAIAAKDGLDLDLVVFSDYLLPNAALDAGDLQANAFQHKPFLENQITAKGYKIVPVGATIVSPIGLYSRRVKAVGDLKAGAKIGIPNDPSNGGRALLLLQAQKLIKLKDGVGILPTVLDVTDNPKTLQFREIDAAQLSRSLDDLDAAVINTNYAVEAGLKPGKDSIAIESSVDNPYSNFIAVRETDKNAPWVPKLVHAYQNDTIRAYITDKRPGEVPAF